MKYVTQQQTNISAFQPFSARPQQPRLGSHYLWLVAHGSATRCQAPYRDCQVTANVFPRADLRQVSLSSPLGMCLVGAACWLSSGPGLVSFGPHGAALPYGVSGFLSIAKSRSSTLLSVYRQSTVESFVYLEPCQVEQVQSLS